MTPFIDGRGGGKDDVAQGGGTDASRVDEALAAAGAAVERATAAVPDASSAGQA